jgi:DNA mismatch endonuclease, patch repair protein
VRTAEQISYNMSRIRGAGSVIERRLGRALWQAGIRYRKQYARVPGRPDFAVVWARVAIFCDSSFWHGRKWPEAAKKIKTNRDFWIPKIERNIARDKEVNMLLTRQGWRHVRFWDDQILVHTDRCVRKVLNVLEQRRRAGTQ